MACRSCFAQGFIDAPTGTEESTYLSEMLGSDDANFERCEATAALNPLCRDLCARDKRLLFRRFFCGWKQQEFAQELGVIQILVSSLLARILDHLRTHLRKLDAADRRVRTPRKPDA